MIALVRLLRPCWRRVARGSVLLIAGDLLFLAIPLAIREVFELLTLRGEAAVEALPSRCLLLIAMAAAMAGTRAGGRYGFASAARETEARLREALLKKALALPLRGSREVPPGALLAYAGHDLLWVRRALEAGLPSALHTLLFGGGALAAMVWLDWKLALWTLLPFPAALLCLGTGMGLLYRHSSRVHRAFQELTERARESLAGMRLLRMLARTEGDRQEFARHTLLCCQRSVEYGRWEALFPPAVRTLMGLATALLLAAGGIRVARGATTLGNFAAFSMYLGQLTWPVVAAGRVLHLVQRGAASLQRVERFLEMPAGKPVPQKAASFRVRGKVEVKELCFAYPGSERPALEGISFSVPAGGSLGVVGPVGSGKSTLLALLAGLSEAPPGSIFLDGVDIRSVPPMELHRAVAVVPQEPFLFSGTIEENLRLAHPEATPEELVRACRAAAIHEEIVALPRGYATPVGEGGATLSRGQRQRLCLARALLQEAPVLLLDEALEAVDPARQERILAHLEKAVGGRTVIAVSHRLRALRRVQEILVLQAGRAVQRGSPRELLSRPGSYRDLYELERAEEP